MKRINTCILCNKVNEPPFTLMKEYPSCECTKQELSRHSEDQFESMKRQFTVYQEPSVAVCTQILESKGYKVSKTNKNKRQRKRRNK